NHHVTGPTLDSFEDSLSAIFKTKNIPVLALPIDYEGEPANVGALHVDEYSLVENLPTINAPFNEEQGDISSLQDQVGYFNSLLEETGLQKHVLSLEQFRGLQTQYRAEIMALGSDAMEIPPPR